VAVAAAQQAVVRLQKLVAAAVVERHVLTGLGVQ
jgi:hypothetical protein